MGYDRELCLRTLRAYKGPRGGAINYAIDRIETGLFFSRMAGHIT